MLGLFTFTTPYGVVRVRVRVRAGVRVSITLRRFGLGQD